MTEHNSAVETNTSSEAGTSSELKISLSFQRWNVTIITRGIVLKYSIFLFVSFPAVFLLLLEVRALEADRFVGLYDGGILALAIVVYAQSLALNFCMLCGAIGTGGNG